MSEEDSPKVLVSYSWDSKDHKDWVRELSERLRLNGVDVKLDQWHVQPGQSLTQFMEHEIVDCGHVLVICTPNYYEKSLKRKGGVGYEQQIISGHIAAGVERNKFIPVVREGEFEPGEECAIPPHFLGIYAIDMRNDESMDQSVEVLLRTIFDQPAHPVPKIGKRPQWDGDEELSEISEIRLATLDLDGYQLLSGLAQHHRTPDTFYMPEEIDRQNLNAGDIVKLIFQIQLEADAEFTDKDGTFGERMWVIVHGKSGPYYIGELNNVPATSGEQENLFLGDTVIFLPEHVIDIDKT